MKNLIVLLMCVSLVSACATTYSGPPPNFKLKGEEATKEFEKFKWSDSFWDANPHAVRMGSERTLTKRDSLDPIIDDVSPTARSRINLAKSFELGNIVLISALMIWLLGVTGSGRKITPEENTPFWIAIGASLGTSLVVLPAISQSAAEHFNEDLKKKFEPGLAFQFSY